MNAVMFHAYEGSRSVLLNYRSNNPNSRYTKFSEKYKLETNEKSNYIDILIAGFCGSIMGCIITSPTELIKCIVQDYTSQNTATIKQEWKEVVSLYKNYGIRKGLFRGFHTTVLRDSWTYAIYFWVYEMICNKMQDSSANTGNNSSNSKQRTTMISFWAGFFAGLTCWGLAYPFDVIKTHYQLEKLEYARLPLLQAVRHHIHYAGGIQPFYIGLNACLIRAGPQHAILFVCYEFVKKQILLLQGKYENENENQDNMIDQRDY